MKKPTGIILVSFAVLSLLSLLLPAQRPVVTEIVTGHTPGDVTVVWPALRYVLEPLAGSVEYILSFSRYIFQLIAWLVWLAVGLTAWGIFKRKQVRWTVSAVLTAWLVCLTLTVTAMLVPFPAPRLVTPSDRIVVDAHDHTFYSHDGVVSPRQSLFFHRRLGFDVLFDTEHGHTDGFFFFPPGTALTTVFPGMQVSTKERVSLVVLADRPFDGAEFRDKTVKEVIDLAHEQGFIVFCPHWWKWRYFTWEELCALGIDGFEVYNAGYRKFSEEERRRLIVFCKNKNLSAWGTTDWHGWGYMSNVWSVLRLPRNSSTSGSDILAYLRARRPVEVMVYRRPELQNNFRYAMEPFFGAYYYFGSLTLPHIAGWMLWITAVSCLAASRRAKRFIRLLPRVLSLVLFAAAIWFLIRWIPLLPENQILGKLLAPILLVLSAGWFILGRLAYSDKNKQV